MEGMRAPDAADKPSKKRRTDPSDAPGWTSKPALKLPDATVEALMTAAVEGRSDSAPRFAIYTEKQLVGKGTKQLAVASGTLVLLEATRTSKVLSADLKRHEAMIDAARAKGHGDVGEPVVVLLGAHQQICRSNCLPKLAALGIGVQRRSAA